MSTHPSSDVHRQHERQSSVLRWIGAHVLRYKLYLSSFLVLTIAQNLLAATLPALTGRAFNVVVQPSPAPQQLLLIAVVMAGVVLLRSGCGLVATYSIELLGQRLARDARDELYASLLSKPQAFHNRQRVGDLMARAVNDVRQLTPMMNPGVALIFDSTMSLAMTMLFIGWLSPQLLLAPGLFTVAFVIALWRYADRIAPIAGQLGSDFGTMNAHLTETIAGIDLVKTSAQEARAQHGFTHAAQRYHDRFVQFGQAQSRYLPPLLLTFATAGALLHGLILVNSQQLSIGDLVTYLGLMSLLTYPTSLSIFTFGLVQLGIASAERLLALLRDETGALAEPTRGYRQPMRGELRFENVSFGYGDTPMLRDVSFHARPGQTVAIVGQAGAGKSTLAKLVNRIYDVDAGRILIDGVDLRDWQLDALRSEVATIEQDIFLFSRSIADNIAFGRGRQADQEAIEHASRAAQAHTFVTRFRDGYDTIIGERGVTLSGGQRQRLAIARALLVEPRILIIDDATSAVDSATEDEIQRALAEVQQARTTILITSRLSQLRRADLVLLLHQGRVIDQGHHAELLTRSERYRRMFATAPLSAGGCEQERTVGEGDGWVSSSMA